MNDDILKRDGQDTYIDRGIDYVDYDVDEHREESRPGLPVEQKYTNTIHQKPGLMSDAMTRAKRSGAANTNRWWK